MHVKSGRAARCCEHQALCVSAQPHQLDLTVNLKVFSLYSFCPSFFLLCFLCLWFYHFSFLQTGIICHSIQHGHAFAPK